MGSGRSKIAFVTLFSITLLAGFALSIEAALGKEMVAPQDDAAATTAQFNLNKAVQRALAESGYDPGPIDGLWGTLSSAALRSFQVDHDLEPTGEIGPETLKKLGLAE